MQKTQHVRLHIYEAAEVPLAVILRQGPSRQARMILWDQHDDTFTEGQWTKQKLYYERCDLSPDGRHFLYFMLDGQWQTEARGSYTAISRPPYFTAVALYPQGDTWGGGGHFVDGRTVFLGGADAEDIIVPGTFRIALGKASLFPRPVRDGTVCTRRFGTEAGRLFELFQEADGSWRKVLLRDFTDMVFEPVRAPYDPRREAGP